MLPREVWDESCMPQSMPHETNNHATMLSTKFNDQFWLISPLIRKDNWEVDRYYVEDYHDHKGEETWYIVFSVDPKQIHVELWWLNCEGVDINIIHGDREKGLEITIHYRSVCWRNEVAVLLQDGDSDSEGLNGRYELNDSGSERDSVVDGDTGATSY